MKDQTLSGGVPYGAIALFAIAFLLYSGFLANLLGSRGTDLAGRGMALGFAAIIGVVLWLVLTGLFVLAWFNGRLPGWLAVAALIVLPLSAIAAAAAAGLAEERGWWLMTVPIALPPLLALFALWGRLPALHGVLPVGPTSAVLGGTIMVLTAVPLVLGWIETMPNPERDAQRAEQQRRYEQETERREQQAREEEEARFARLGPQSSLGDYLDYLPPGSTRHAQGLAGARLVKSRNQDAVALLREGRLRELEALWQLDLDPAQICPAYGAALQAQAMKIDRSQPGYVSAALDIEWQLPNMKWLAAARCDFDQVLALAETRVRAIADNVRLTGIADQVAALRRQPR
jgi:hypothetical protein